MKLFVLTAFLFFSCDKLSENDITIHTAIDKKKSLLLLKIKNNTDQNLMIEFPELEDFFYEDEIEASKPEFIYTQKSFEVQDNKEDLSIIKNSKCRTISNLSNFSSISIPKFIKGNSEKTYYLKITRYRSGKTILFEDIGFDYFKISDSNKQKEINMIKIQDCSGYKYFRGTFRFYPNKLILE